MEELHNSSRFKSEFCILGTLGEGGFGTVFRAKHNLDEKEYALKKIRFKGDSAKILQVNLREVKALARLSHPNIIRYNNTWKETDFEPSDESDDQNSFSTMDSSQSRESFLGSLRPSFSLFIQMELCSRTLRQWLDERNQSVTKEKGLVSQKVKFMPMFQQILNGVEYIHSQNLIHRDLKPENIFLQGDENHIKIGDFGLAQEALHQETCSTHSFADGGQSATGISMVGTIPYAAPEMTSGLRYTNKCDIYSLGIIFVEMCQRIMTKSELCHIARDYLLQGKLPGSLKGKEWMSQAKAIQKMVSPSELRPSAEDLLTGPLFLTLEQENKTLKERLERKNMQIKLLKKNLRDKNVRLKIKTEQLAKMRKRHPSGGSSQARPAQLQCLQSHTSEAKPVHLSYSETSDAEEGDFEFLLPEDAMSNVDAEIRSKLYTELFAYLQKLSRSVAGQFLNKLDSLTYVELLLLSLSETGMRDMVSELIACAQRSNAFELEEDSLTKLFQEYFTFS